MTRHIAKNQVFPVNSRLCSKHLINGRLTEALLQVQFVLEKHQKKASDFFFVEFSVKKNDEIDVFLKIQIQRRRPGQRYC